MNDKKIAICSHCREPLISTCAFCGAEYYCLICGSTYGILSAERTNMTEKLKYKQKMYKKIFKLLYKDYIPYSCYFDKCEKCKSFTEYHSEHATEKDLLKSKWAMEILNKIAKEVDEE